MLRSALLLLLVFAPSARAQTRAVPVRASFAAAGVPNAAGLYSWAAALHAQGGLLAPAFPTATQGLLVPLFEQSPRKVLADPPLRELAVSLSSLGLDPSAFQALSAEGRLGVTAGLVAQERARALALAAQAAAPGLPERALADLRGRLGRYVGPGRIYLDDGEWTAVHAAFDAAGSRLRALREVRVGDAARATASALGLPEEDAAVPAVSAEDEKALAALDPAAAARLLTDADLLLLLEKDPSRGAGLLLRANLLDDLRELLELHRDPGELRAALLLRMAPGSVARELGELSEVPGLLAWTALRLPARLDLVRRAVLEWGTLLPAQKAWLEAKGRGEGGWSALALKDRADAVSGWAWRERDELEKLVPAIEEGEVAAMAARFSAVQPFLSGDAQSRLYRRVEQARTLLSLRRALEARLREGEDAALEGALRELEGTGPLGERLERLARLLKGREELLGKELSGAVEQHRDARTGESFSPEELSRLSERLREALLAELGGTLAGEGILEFYRHAEFPALSVRSTPGMKAFYRPPGEMALSVEAVLEWLRVEGVEKRALLSEPALQRRLARRLAPSFVHEATHHGQYAWRRERGALMVFTQDDEIEAYTAEALYTVEKALREPGYPGELDQDEREAADRLREDPRNFRRIIRRIYTDLPSWRFFAAETLRLVSRIEAELRRRDALPAAERDFLERSRGDYGLRWQLEHRADVSGDLPSLKTVSLERLRETLVDGYLDAEARIEETVARAEKALKSLLASRPAL
ncbi:MAG: hypothetical protein WC969_07140 [Elusimicrobiota bacterium]|jgi:hypothetical protein